MKALAQLPYPIVFALTVGLFMAIRRVPDRTYLGGRGVERKWLELGHRSRLLCRTACHFQFKQFFL